jgi:hypothetical protein
MSGQQQMANKARTEKQMGITVASVVGLMMVVGITKWAMDWREISSSQKRRVSRDDDWTYHGPDDA